MKKISTAFYTMYFFSSEKYTSVNTGLAGWLAGWLDGWLASKMIGWLVRC
jgi:hypothetical protein